MKNSADLGGCYLLRLKAKTKEIENQTWLKSLNPEFHFDLQYNRYTNCIIHKLEQGVGSDVHE